MKILLAVDDDPVSYRAAAATTEWFRPDAEIVVLHVETGMTSALAHSAPGLDGMYAGVGMPMDPMVRDDIPLSDHEREIAERAANLAHGTPRTERGDAVGTIVSVAQEIDADLIVLGTHDRSWLSRLFDPSVSSGVIHRAPCSVLVVRLDGESVPPDKSVDAAATSGSADAS